MELSDADLYHRLLISQLSKPAIVENYAYPPNCSYSLGLFRPAKNPENGQLEPRVLSSAEIASIAYVFPFRSIEDAVREFPAQGRLELVARVVGDSKDSYSYLFYKDKKSDAKPIDSSNYKAEDGFELHKRLNWDIVLTYRQEDGMPVRLYYAKGTAVGVPSREIVVAIEQDIIFYFSDNQEDASQDNFNLNKMAEHINVKDKGKIPHSHYTCNGLHRFDLNEILKRDRKLQKGNLAPKPAMKFAPQKK